MIKYSEIFISFTQEDVDAYNSFVIDGNPIHYDIEFCKKTVFEAPIVPGLLTSGLFGGLLGSKLPKGAILLGINLKFIAPVYIDEQIMANIELIKQREDKPIVTYRLICKKSDGRIAVEGEAILKT